MQLDPPFGSASSILNPLDPFVSLLLALWPLLLVLCSYALDSQAWKQLCGGTEASCGGRGTGWWRWQCGGCRRHSGQLCSLWLRRLWTGVLRCYYNCSDVTVGIKTVGHTRWHVVTADKHLLFTCIDNKQTHTKTKTVKTWNLSLLLRGDAGEKQEVSYICAKQVVATQPQWTYVNH